MFTDLELNYMILAMNNYQSKIEADLLNKDVARLGKQ